MTEQRASTNFRCVTYRLTPCQKNLPRRNGVEFKAATLRDDKRIMASQFRKAVLRSKRRDGGGASYLRTTRYRDHDSRLSLTFLRRLDGEAAAAPDNREDVEEIDGEHGIEEHLTVGLRHTIPLQPAIDNHKVFDLHGETRRRPAGGFANIALTLPHRDVS